MIRLSRILLPTDFSLYSSEATKYACAFAEKFDAELHLLHVLETRLSATPEFAAGIDGCITGQQGFATKAFYSAPRQQ